MLNFTAKLKMLVLGLSILLVFGSFNLIGGGPGEKTTVASDTVSHINGVPQTPEAQEQGRSESQPKIDKPKEQKSSKTISTLSVNVLHYLIYKFILSDILSDEKPEDKERIISMA